MSTSLALYLFRSPFNWTVVGLGFAVAAASAADWPQFRGPTRDGVSPDRINKEWSGNVTNPVWRLPITNALCGFAVSGERAFTQVSREIDSTKKDVCVALSITNGAEQWARALEDWDYPEDNTWVGYDGGPRTTPVAEGGSVYVLSSHLKLYRLSATDGAVIWQKDLLALHGGSVPRFQNAASPLVDNGLIYLNANCGTNTLMALRTTDGSLAWRSQNEILTHSTPTLATIHGVRQLLFATGNGVVSLDPQTGARFWKFNYPFPFDPMYSIAVSPVVYQDLVFVSGTRSGNYGSVVRRVTFTNSTWTTTQLWFTNDPACTFSTPVVHEGFLYGQFCRFGFDNAQGHLKCVELLTGAIKWSAPNFGRGGTVMIDKHLLVLTETGDLVLAEVNTNAYVEVGRLLAIPDYDSATNKCWTPPAVAGGRVYVRGSSMGACFDLSVPALKLDPPQLLPANRFELTIRTVDGSPISSARLPGLEVRASTNLGLLQSTWEKLTNELIFTNGMARVTNVDGSISPKRYFIVTEPN